MFGKSRTETAKQNTASSAAEFASALAQDKKFRKQLLAATGHGMRAKKSVASRIGTISLLTSLAADEDLREELRDMAANLQAAWTRLETKRSHRIRNTFFVVVGAVGAAAAAIPQVRRQVERVVQGTSSTIPRTVQAEIDVDVPVSTAYNQWRQFEEFPAFMEGVEEVRQLDDSRLHWVASVAGKHAQWDAKIVEQHPDQQISWISEDGKKTRGTVTFQPLGDARTHIQISMSYQAEGLREAIGSAAGLDTRRVRGDLERFKDLIEGRDGATGAWRGEISVAKTG